MSPPRCTPATPFPVTTLSERCYRIREAECSCGVRLLSEMVANDTVSAEADFMQVPIRNRGSEEELGHGMRLSAAAAAAV